MPSQYEVRRGPDGDKEVKIDGEWEHKYHEPRTRDRDPSQKIVKRGNCNECQGNRDPNAIPLHPNCGCEVVDTPRKN